MISEKSETGIRVYRNDKEISDGEVVFRWGCTSDIEAEVIVNSAKSIRRVADKLNFRKLLEEHELGPRTWFNTEDTELPCIVRPQTHHQGRNLFVCRTYQELNSIIRRLGGIFYSSEIINKVSEYRVFVVQNRVVCVAQKFPNNSNDIAWNVFQGGRFENVSWDDWHLKAVRISLEAFELSKLDFGGVDVMVDEDNNVFVLEINSAPSLTSDYRQECFSKAFDWIVTHGKEIIPLKKGRGGYRKFIHPAVCDRAEVPIETL